MQSQIGKVVSSKTPQTLTVVFSYTTRHPKYKKILKKETRMLVHCELDGIKEGDLVKCVKSRPFSKNKHFQAVEIISSEAKTK
jgi:small subunit ribosomal protein S17